MSNPPVPSNAADLARINEQRRRRRLLYSDFERDVIELMQAQLGTVRRSAWGRPDLTANPYLSISEKVSQLYAEEPSITGPGGHEELLAHLAEVGTWPMMQRVQRDTFGLREMLVRGNVERGQLVLTPVFPDMIDHARTSARTPGQPEAITEFVDLGGERWARMITDLGDPAKGIPPALYAEDVTGRDVSEEVLGHPRLEGDAYPYRNELGEPILNYVVYHAAETGRLWDYQTLAEVAEGSLNICLLLSYYQHMVRNCSWPQRWAVNVSVGGSETVTTDGAQGARREVTTDPATVLILHVDEEGGQPMVGQWQPAGDPEAVLRSVGVYEERIVVLAGLDAPGATKQESDIRSGYSLAVAQDSIRRQQRVFEPMFRRGDLQLIALAAALLNSATGSNYPEAGYRIQYRGLPPSPVEERAEREHVLALLDAGMISPVAAFMRLHPGVTEEEAARQLADIAAARRTFAA